MIRLENVRFAYGRQPFIENLGCELPDGRITAILGPNGSGKSTMLRLCAGQIRPQAGEISVNGRGLREYSQKELARLDYRMKWEDDFRAYLKKLDEVKPVILCGDLNVAHKEIDLKNPKTNRKNAGFTDEERGKFTQLLNAGFVDSFRHFHPDAAGEYSWWSYIRNARATNAGWRIDYFVVSEKFKDRMESACIHQEIFGSDHCPVELVVKE